MKVLIIFNVLNMLKGMNYKNEDEIKWRKWKCSDLEYFSVFRWKIFPQGTQFHGTEYILKSNSFFLQFMDLELLKCSYLWANVA